MEKYNYLKILLSREPWLKETLNLDPLLSPTILYSQPSTRVPGSRLGFGTTQPFPIRNSTKRTICTTKPRKIIPSSRTGSTPILPNLSNLNSNLNPSQGRDSRSSVPSITPRIRSTRRRRLSTNSAGLSTRRGFVALWPPDDCQRKSVSKPTESLARDYLFILRWVLDQWHQGRVVRVWKPPGMVWCLSYPPILRSAMVQPLHSTPEPQGHLETHGHRETHGLNLPARFLLHTVLLVHQYRINGLNQVR